MRLLLLACLGGAIGSGARYLMNVGVGRWLGAGFPWATLSVNVIGSFLMGLLIEAIALRFNGSPELRTFLATGILGGFTTFSAFSLEVALMLENGETASAAMYIAASVVLSVLALFAGLHIARAVFA